VISDVTRQLGAVQRVTSSREYDGKPARVVRARVVRAIQTYDSAIEDVWDACTNPERIPRWFLPVSGDLRLGGRYQLEGNAGGEVLSCEPPRRLAATWEFGGGMSWVELNLAETADGRTTFTLEHIAPDDDPERWEQYGPGAVGVGWDLTLLGLSAHLATGASNDPAATMAWAASEEAREFMTRSSELWADASIAAGEDEATARAAQKRTTDFYTAPAPTGE
jgi:uncharacterized protein YndB with AHSA1/START domain